MWAIRRASNPIRNQSCCILTSHIFSAKPVTPSNLENRDQSLKEHHIDEACHVTRPISLGGFFSPVFLVWGRNFSSQVRAKLSDKDDDLEDGFSELEIPPEADKIVVLGAKDDDDMESEGDCTAEDGDDVVEDALALSDSEADHGEKAIGRRIEGSPLFKVIMESHTLANILDKWVEEGNPLGQGEISVTLLNLRKRRLYEKALQFMEWLEASRQIDLGERYYASRLDLVAKVQGLQKAEKYIDKIPQSFRGEIIYRTLLANCVVVVNVKKSEEVFNKIRDLGFTISTFACNQLIMLYRKVDRKKIGDVLKIMEKEDVKPSLFTYRLLVDTKGRIHDIPGMEDVIRAMKAEGIEPDINMQAIVAKHYIYAGHNEKAEATLKEIEGDDINQNRAACKSLLPLYASLEKTDDVRRIWNVCYRNPTPEECFAAVESWGRLGKVEDAEEVFEKMIKSWKKLPSKYYNALLKVYANHKLLSKGKELAKRMSDSGCKIGPFTLDALIKLYMEAGEVEKAYSILQKASEQNQIKPFYTTYIYVLNKYADRGDIHNAEKIFNRLRQIGFVGRMKQYQLLLRAYVNAKTPAYGFWERMKADNVFPNKCMITQLQAVDAFRKTQISELLD